MRFEDREHSVLAALTEPQAPSEPGPGRSFRQAPAASADALSAFLNPSAIAIIGASDNPNKIGGRPILYLSRFGYSGRIYPVNPKRTRVQGLKTYPDLASLPEAPDLAVVATPAANAVQAVDECAARGVRGAIVMASGFGETADAASIAVERDMVARARAGGMRLVGPNSQGLANFATGAVASFSTMFLEVAPADGPVAVISQSGMMSVAPYGLLRGRGIGVRHAHATGNDADVSLAELALAVLQDPAVRLLLLYIESIRDADTLARAADVAREHDVPIVAVKAGRTARGQAAARSHTGALANEDRIVDAFFRQHGIWRARDIHDLVGAAELYLKGWRPESRRLVVMSNSGASCVMAADSVQDVKLELARLDDRTVAAMTAELPSFATTTNPIDVTAALLTNSDLFGRILAILAGDPAGDLVLVAMPVAGAGYDVGAFARAAGKFAARANSAIVVAAPQETVAARFREEGVPTFSNQTEAIAALAQLAHHTRLMRRGRAQTTSPRHIELARGPSRFLDEAESLEFLRAQGMSTIAFRLCRSEVEAREAFRQLGGSVALKGCSATLPHKSDRGLVMLDVDDEQDVARGFVTLRSRLSALGANGQVIVARMARSRGEFMLGARVDPVFGPVLIVGNGGRYVEALADVAVLLPPVSAEDVREALFTLRVAPLLESVRGEPALDVASLCAAAVRLGEIIVSGASQIASIDLNPVIVGAEGEGVVIVDALIERAHMG